MGEEQKRFECSAEEADVLAAIKQWPNVPATVTYHPESGWRVSTSKDDAHRQYQEMGLFDRTLIDAEYHRLGFSKGWTFMMCPEARLGLADMAIVGLNPGGGSDRDEFAYTGDWDVPQGNAYFRPWEANKPPSPIQQQVQWWHKIAGLGPNDTFCAQFVPFRSPDWERLGNFDEALAFSRRLWRWALARSPATTFVAMGKVAGGELSRLLGCEPCHSYDSGWGDVRIGLAKSSDGKRVITMPHPSRYLLFGRGAPSETAEAGLRLALTA